MARIGDDKLDDLRARADIVEVIGAQVRLRKAGRNYVGLCPFHQEKTPSFSVNRERGFFHCFGCGVGGTVFDFVMRVEALTFPEAVRSLARRYGVEIPERGEPGMPSSEREALITANQVAAEFYAHVLWNTPDGSIAREYLKSRAITVETAKTFMLGYAPARPSSLAAALNRRGLAKPGAVLGLVREDSDGARDLFRARLMFPIRDVQARVIGFGGRVLDQRLPKYINSPESPLYSKARSIYGISEARQTIVANDRVIVVEGYIDAIMLAQAGFKETVASLGTALTADQLRILGRYTKNVLACFDGDDAGRHASLRALEVFLDAGLLARGVFIPSGYDPDTLVRERGASAFAEALEKAISLYDYLVETLAEAAADEPSRRAEAARTVAELLKKVRDPFVFNALSQKASKLGIEERLLREHARPIAAKGSDRRTLFELKRPAADAGFKAEVGLVALAIFHPLLRKEIQTAARTGDFEDRTLSELLLEMPADESGLAELESRVSERLQPEQRSMVSALAVDPQMDDAERARKLAGDFLRTLGRRRTRREIESLTRGAAGSDDPSAAQAVIVLRRGADGRK
jgi:DNA primase